MKRKIVIALGGNALGISPEEQLKLVKATSKHIVDLIEAGNDIVITHGNGPQVGMINLSMETANTSIKTPEMPFAECGAMSQGYIGYHLQQSIQNELLNRKIEKECLTVVTQVEVDKNDLAFKNPTKPIGGFYTVAEAKKIAQEKRYVMKEDSGRGYRRVIASPSPKRILELRVIRNLIDNGNIVIAGGGGGIPVIRYSNEYKGIDAVIDKDKTSAKLALGIEANILLILTTVDHVSINFLKENEQKLTNINLKEAQKFIKDNEFAEGSMLPKIEACIEFVEKTNNNNNYAIITSLNNAMLALQGSSGTIIKKE